MPPPPADEAVSREVQAYLDALPVDRRALFDRVHALLHVGAWKHGLSFYGWDSGRDGGLTARHPELDSGKGTLRLTFAAAEQISDDELRAFVRATLGD